MLGAINPAFAADEDVVTELREITERLNNTSVYKEYEKYMVLNTINRVYVTGERLTLELDKLNAFDKILALEYLEQDSKDTAISRIKTALSSDYIQELVDKFTELNEANKPAEPTPEKPAQVAPVEEAPVAK